MSGHSKWANIKVKKAKTDSVRGKVFTKIGRELAIAVKQGGGADPAVNGRLRDVIAKAKAANMPNDTINRSIKKASGDDGSANYEEIVYEGYGVGGVAIIIEVLTDNRNRTASDVRHLLDKYGNGLGTSGCVAWMFDKKGVIVIDIEAVDEDTIMMQALEAGAQDIRADGDCYEIVTEPSEFSAVREALEALGYDFLSAEIAMIPNNTVQVSDAESVDKVVKLIDLLEDNDDVQNVYHNADLPDEE